MHQWLNARCAKLLEELNQTPFTDDVDEIKLNLIRSAMREASLEMFHRAAENSRKKIEKINKQTLSATIEEVESELVRDMDDAESPKKSAKKSSSKSSAPADNNSHAHGAMNTAFSSASKVDKENTSSEAPAEKGQTDDDKPAVEDKPKPKIQISSSVIRRAD